MRRIGLNTGFRIALRAFSHAVWHAVCTMSVARCLCLRQGRAGPSPVRQGRRPDAQGDRRPAPPAGRAPALRAGAGRAVRRLADSRPRGRQGARGERADRGAIRQRSPRRGGRRRSRDGVVALFLHGSTINYSKVHEIRTGLEVQMAAAAACAQDGRRHRAARARVRTRRGRDFTTAESPRCTTSSSTVPSALRPTTSSTRAARRGRSRAARCPAREPRHAEGRQPHDPHHRAILDAIRAGSEPAAAEAMRLHLEDVERLWNEVSAERIDGAGASQAIALEPV